MKRLFSLLLILAVLVAAVPSLAQENYPECMGTVTDLALVFSDEAASDLKKLSDRYEDKTDGSLYVVTRHFLGGKDVKEYANALFSAWDLTENDVLVLMVIGEESYAMSLGKKAASAIPEETRSTFFASYFHDAFMAREYDKAAGELCTAVLSRVASAQAKSLNTSGLFGSSAQNSALHVYEQDLGSLFSTFFEEEQPKEEQPSVLREDKSTGISIWKILLVFFILRAIFRKKKKKKRRIIF